MHRLVQLLRAWLRAGYALAQRGPSRHLAG
jgi:hypothetical protein